MVEKQNVTLENRNSVKPVVRTPLVLFYPLSTFHYILLKHWNLLHISQTIRTAFEEKPVIAYRRNKNLRDIIGGNKVLNNKKIIKPSTNRQLGISKPCLTRRDNLCCQQVLKTESFKSYRTGQTFRIYHNLTCKSFGLIYLLQCQVCLLQYIGKSETPFNLRLNNHRKDAKDTTSKNNILACKHFQQPNHDFQRHAKFTLIEKITKSCISTAQIRLLLKKRENFWILKLKTLYPDGLNQELNDV